MSNQYLSFDVTKQSTPQQLITGRQGDSQLKFVTMLFWDGDKNIPYDLTGKQVVFEALKPDNTHIVDYEGITVLDAPAGLVRYSFNEQVFSVAGTMQQAFFKITHTDSDNNVIADSTLEVAINILKNHVEFGINSKDYLSEYDDLITKVKKKFDDYANVVQNSIDTAAKVHDEVTNLLAQVEGIQLAIKRRVAVKDSNTVKMSQEGNWDNENDTTISANVKISTVSHVNPNIISIDEGEGGGLYVPKEIPKKYEVDFSQTPFYYGAVDDIQQSVTQSLLMTSNFEMYNIQANVNNAPDTERHATISHLNPSGVIIDTMEVLHSGHGSGWKLIEDGSGNVSFLFIGLKDGVNKVVSLKYQANTRIDIFDNDDIKTFPNPNNEYGTFLLDIKNNKIGLVRNDGDNDIVNIYLYEDFVNLGLGSTVIKSFRPDILTLQGAVMSENHIYIYNATINLDDQKIIDINTDSGEYNFIKLGRLGQDPQVKYEQSLEGEDILTWTNPITGEVSYMIAVATGYAGGTKRLIKLYMWNGPDNKLIFEKLFNEKVQSLKLYDGDGSAFTLDAQPNNISDITTPGFYYFNGTNFKKFVDRPVEYATANDGFFIIVYPNNKSYVMIQEIMRLNYDGYNMRFTRAVNRRINTKTDWIYNDSYSNHTLKPVNTLTLLSQLNVKGEYYLNTNEWKSLQDVPTDPLLGYGTSGFFVKVGQQNTDGEVIQECFRNTRGDDPIKLVRTAFSKSEVSKWLIIKNE